MEKSLRVDKYDIDIADIFFVQENCVKKQYCSYIGVE